MQRTRGLLGVFVILLGASCGAPGVVFVEDNSPTLEATVESNALYAGSQFLVDARVTNFELDQDNYGGDSIEGHGHFHVYLDEISDLSKLKGSGTSPVAVELPKGTTLGDHTLYFTLQHNDHTPVEPPVEVAYPITVIQPLLVPAAPGPIAALGNFDVSVAISNFQLDPANYGGDNIYGHGHYHVYLDMVAPETKLKGSAVSPATVAMPDIAPGSHTLIFTLQNNDHSDFLPAVNIPVDVTIDAAAP